MVDYDLVVRNGRIFTPEGSVDGDIGMRGGKIAAIGPGLGSGARNIDAKGGLVLPGGVDGHCHIDQLTSTGARTADTFRTASIPAAFGGTTTLMPFAVQHRGTSLRAAVEDYRSRAEGQSFVDYAFHLIVTDPNEETLETDLPALAEEGFTSVKIYLTYDALKLDDRSALDVLAVARRERMMVMIHAESHDLIGWLTDRMISRGFGDLKYFSRSRPVIAERDATHHAITMAELIDVPILIVHVSSQDALEQIRWSRQQGVRTYAETCPQYLVLSEKDLDRPHFEAAKYCCSPPLRDRRHQRALWNGITDGSVDVFSSDHSAFFFEGPDGKMRNGRDVPFNKVPYGLPGLETRLPLLFSEGVSKNRISLADFVRVTATRPAELYGLKGRKGVLAVGADADIVVWDETREVVIEKRMLHDEIDYTPYEGFKVVGWPRTTIVGGVVVCDDGELRATTAEGRLLKCDRPEAAMKSGRPVTGYDVTDDTLTME